jgi:hypothetical protein
MAAPTVEGIAPEEDILAGDTLNAESANIVPGCCLSISSLTAIVMLGFLLVVAAHIKGIPKLLKLILNMIGWTYLNSVFILFWQLYQRLITPCYLTQG